MNQIISRIPLYIEYFLKQVDLHSLQAPFVYSLYGDVIDASGPENSKFEEIEKIRESLLVSNQKISYQTFGKRSSFSSTRRNKIATITRGGISSKKDSLLFCRLIQYFNSKKIIELGSSLGINTAYLSLASNVNSSIFTFEGHDELVEIAGNTFEQLKLRNVNMIRGNIDDQLPDLLNDHSDFDFVLIDANHDYDAVINYFGLFEKHLKENNIIVIDDIRWSKDMYRAWNNIIRKNCVTLSIDLGHLGVLLFKKGISKQHYMLAF